MKNLKTTLFKAGLIALGLSPLFSNGQFITTGAIGTAAAPTYTSANVGIGTANPGVWFPPPVNVLQINGGRPTISLTPTAVGGIATIQFRGQTGYTATTSPTTSEWAMNFIDGNPSKLTFSSYQFAGGATPVFSLMGGGNVGIGVSNPTTKLQVDGNISLTSEYYTILFPPSNPGLFVGGITGDDGNNKRLTLFHGNAIAFEIGNTSSSSNTKMLIDQSGNIGIGTGTTAPRAKLDVSGQVVIGTRKTTATDYQLSVDGKIYCTELNVTPGLPATGNSNWADYVFKSDYKLASLTQVEKYIKENGHLENVPSAEQVAKTGYKVGEMDATLLRKVEELTLYVIELKKEISELKAKK